MPPKTKEDAPAINQNPSQAAPASGPVNPFSGNGPFSENTGPLPPSLGLPAGQDETFEEDFTDVEGGFTPFPNGRYPAVVIGFSKGESRNTGNPQYEWEFKVTDGDFRNKTIRSWTSLVPAARWKVVEYLEACGIGASGSIARFKKSDLIGKPVVLEIAVETYQGKESSKIQRLLPPNEEALAAAAAMSGVPQV